jgi:hypothetical protein
VRSSPYLNKPCRPLDHALAQISLERAIAAACDFPSLRPYVEEWRALLINAEVKRS